MAPLGLVAAMDRVFLRMDADEERWTWGLQATRAIDPESRIDEIAGWCDVQVPGRLEASIRAAGGSSVIQQETAVLLHFEPSVLDALCRDPQLSPKLK